MPPSSPVPITIPIYAVLVNLRAGSWNTNMHTKAEPQRKKFKPRRRRDTEQQSLPQMNADEHSPAVEQSLSLPERCAASRSQAPWCVCAENVLRNGWLVGCWTHPTEAGFTCWRRRASRACERGTSPARRLGSRRRGQWRRWGGRVRRPIWRRLKRSAARFRLR